MIFQLKNPKKSKKKKKKKKSKSKSQSKSQSIDNCIICNKSLRSLSPTRQQLHINSCLDISENSKDYKFTNEYKCPVCYANLTCYSTKERRNHMKICADDAEQRNHDIEFEESPFKAMDKKRKKKQKVEAKLIISTEFANIFERKFECLMCNKSLSRFKLRGRCNHLKSCAKKTGKDIYTICELYSIDKNIIDNPDKYKNKFETCYYKNQKKKNNNKNVLLNSNSNNNVDIELGDLGLFAMGGSKHMLRNNRLKEMDMEIESLFKRKKRNISLNNYDEYIKEEIKYLSELNNKIHKLEQARQHSEIRLQRAKQLKKEHEESLKAEQQSILASLSPKKGVNNGDDGGGKGDNVNVNSIDFGSEMVVDTQTDNQNINGNNNRDDVKEPQNDNMKDILGISPKKPSKLLVDNLFNVSLNSSQKASISPQIRLKKSSVMNYDKHLLLSSSSSSSPKKIISFSKTSTPFTLKKIKKRKNLWNIAQAPHQITPSQFKLSQILPKDNDNDNNNNNIRQRSASNTTQLMLDDLCNDDDMINTYNSRQQTDDDDMLFNSSRIDTNNNNNNNNDRLIEEFFNEPNSIAPNLQSNIGSFNLSQISEQIDDNDDCNDKLDISILEEENKLILNTNNDNYDDNIFDNINNDNQNCTFPIDLELSVTESFFIDANKRSNNNNNNSKKEILLNDNSMQSNNGSLIDTDDNKMDIISISDDNDDNQNDNNNNNNNDTNDNSFSKYLNNDNDISINWDSNTNMNDISMSLSPQINKNKNKNNNFVELNQNIITPILPIKKHSKKQAASISSVIRDKPLRNIPITPMIGAEKDKILHELNLYFNTPQIERNQLRKPISLPSDIPGRKEYLNKINCMSLDQLKKEIKKYGLKHASKCVMKQRLEMIWDALNPNSPMIRALNKHINDNQSQSISESESINKEIKKKKKTKIEIEYDVIELISKTDDLLLKISTFTTIKFEEIDKLLKLNNIKMAKAHLQKFLDEQGIGYVMPDDPNAQKGPRRPGRKRRNK